METTYYREWQPIRIYAHGLQPHLAKGWRCLPAWDLMAVYAEPDEYLPYPEAARAVEEPPRDNPFVETGLPVFWNRHVDRRYHIEYPRVTKDTPRQTSLTVGDSDREWEMLLAHRDKVLAASGLTLDSPPEAVARCLADTFKWASPFYHTKPHCAVLEGRQTRQLNHPIEALLAQCYCVGCAHLFVALADACGLAARNVGLHGHHAAEVLVDGRWHYVENTCRHEANPDLEAFFPVSWMELTLHPERCLDCMPPKKAGDYWGADNGDYCLMGGSWRSPLQLLFAADCACALYPELDRRGFKGLGEGGRLMPITRRLQGFLWMDDVHGGEAEARRELRRRTAPFPIENPSAHRTFLYHPLRPGDRLRHSFWLDAVDDMERLEWTVPLAPEPHVEFTEAFGRQLVVRVGDWRSSLAEAGTWPPPLDETTGHRHCRVTVPRDALKPHAVNWVELHQESALTLHHPVTPAAMEPYIAPLWSETGEAP